jgi:hypothetical protein
MVNSGQGPGKKGHEDIYGIRVLGVSLTDSGNVLDPETEIVFRLYANHPINAIGAEIH